MSPDEIQQLIDQKQRSIQAFDDQIQTERERGQVDVIPGIESQKHDAQSELTRLQSEVLPQAQKAEQYKIAEQAREDEKKRNDGGLLSF